MKNQTKTESNDKLRTSNTSSEKSSELGDFSANFFDEVFSRIMTAVGTTKAVDVANALGISQQSISGAKSKAKIPEKWLSKISDKYGVSSDWLRTGEGEMTRVSRPMVLGEDGVIEKKTKAAPQACAELGRNHSSYNDNRRRDISIADMLAKTARVLESDTVYREALYSNIEAFHHGVTMDERLGKMDAKFDQVMNRLDALEAENQQLRQELEQSRAGSTLSDTG